mgnify:CR=1 FL=1
MGAILELSDVTVRRGERIILGPLNWQVLEGQRWVVLGPNGAGKTTMFRCILDLIQPKSGIVKLKDFIVSNNEEWKEYTGSYLDEHFLIDFLTPEEYFYFIGELRGV